MTSKTEILLPLLAVGISLSTAHAAQFPDPLTAEDFHPTESRQVALGKLLAYDKILSGNLNISCLTCHHPFAGTGDGLSLPVGEGGEGLGVTRNTGTSADAVHERVPRNAPPLFALGAKDFTFMFHDGRVTVDDGHPSGFITPAGDFLPQGLDNIVAAQAMFPVTSGAEMAGQAGENPQGDATSAVSNGNFSAVWNHIADKIKANSTYVDLFTFTFDDVNSANDITYVHVANAVAAFEIDAWRCNNTPFDAFVGGDFEAMNRQQRDGAVLFYGKAGCADCHSGKLLSDMDFHAIAMPQIGPGKGDNQAGYSDGRDDFGRERETGNPTDRFKFRTPPLRMVTMTAPYGHSGAYDTLDAVVRHHLDPVHYLNNYDSSQTRLPSRSDLDAEDFVVQDDPVRRQAVADANELNAITLSDAEVNALVAFLHTLTDPSCLDLRKDVPRSLPSGLPLFD